MVMRGENIATGHSPTCEDCGVTLELSVQKSAAGYYLGTFCDCGPYSRESDYFKTRKQAEKALETVKNCFSESLAAKAVREFEQTNTIPNLGQRYSQPPDAPGCIHIFPDGSTAMHWNHGGFTMGEPD